MTINGRSIRQRSLPALARDRSRWASRGLKLAGMRVPRPTAADGYGMPQIVVCREPRACESALFDHSFLTGPAPGCDCLLRPIVGVPSGSQRLWFETPSSVDSVFTGCRSADSGPTR